MRQSTPVPVLACRWPYRLICFVRHWSYDTTLVAVALAVAWWWVHVSDATDLPEVDLTADQGSGWLLSAHVARYFPTATAVVVFVVLLRSDRVARFDGKGRVRGSTAAAAPSFLFMLVLAALFGATTSPRREKSSGAARSRTSTLARTRPG